MQVHHFGTNRRLTPHLVGKGPQLPIVGVKIGQRQSTDGLGSINAGSILDETCNLPKGRQFHQRISQDKALERIAFVEPKLAVMSRKARTQQHIGIDIVEPYALHD